MYQQEGIRQSVSATWPASTLSNACRMPCALVAYSARSPKMWCIRSLRQSVSASRHQARQSVSASRHTDGMQHTLWKGPRMRVAPHAAASTGGIPACTHTLVAYVSIRQHTSAYVGIRRHTSAYVSIPACTHTLVA